MIHPLEQARHTFRNAVKQAFGLLVGLLRKRRAADPAAAEREAARDKWAKFRRALQPELKARLGDFREVLVLPEDGVRRHEAGQPAGGDAEGGPWIEVIAPDDGTLLNNIEDRAIDDAIQAGSFYVEAEIVGIDSNRDVYAVIEVTARPEGEKAEWRITFAPHVEVPAPAFVLDENDAVLERMNVSKQY